MRLSEYKAGTILVDGDGKVFIHDGFVNADGYGVVIGENSDGIIQKSNRIGNWMRRKAAIEKQLHKKSLSFSLRFVRRRRLSITKRINNE